MKTTNLAPQGYDLETAVNAAVTAAKARGFNISEVSDNVDTSRIQVGNAQTLPVGTRFAIVGSKQITAVVDGVTNSYPAFVVLTQDGKTHLISYNALIQPWMPAKLEEHDKRNDMYKPEEYAKVTAFHSVWDKPHIVNSHKQGFVFSATIEERLEKLTASPLKVEAIETVRGTLTRKDTGAVQPFNSRMFALTADDKATFEKDVAAALAARK